MEETKIDVSQLFAILGEQLRENTIVAAVAVVVLVVGNLALDRMGTRSTTLPAGLLSLAMQLFVTRSALVRSGQISSSSKSKLGSFWRMNILTNIAIILGCVLLLIPGLYLAARWMIASPAVIGEDLSATEAMRASWERTRSSVWQIVAALLLVVGGGFVAAMVPFLLYPENGVPLAVQTISYSFAFAGIVSGWLMAVGTYRQLSGSEDALVEVFA